MKVFLSQRSVVCKCLFCITMIVGHFSLCLLAAAQPSKAVPRIGFLASASASDSPANVNAFREGLRDLGYIEGQNILVEYRHADGNIGRLAKLASDLVRSRVDIIVTGGTQSILATKKVTSEIPVVAGAAGDLVGTGLVASLAKPGGNVTGSTTISPDISGKRVELVKDVVPKAARVAVLLYAGSGTDRIEVKQTEAAAQAFNLKIQNVEVRNPSDFPAAYAAIKREKADALLLFQSSLTNAHRKQLIQHAANGRLPTICESARWTEDGCVTSYGPDLLYQYRRAAVYVDKILKGAEPRDLPIEQPTKFELVINLRTAKQIGITIPPSILARADKVIK